MKKSHHHTIDFLFPIALFFVFSAVSLIVLLLSANIYKNLVTTSDSSFTQTTALSYISQKIRQNDTESSDRIYLTTFDDQDTLAIQQTYNGQEYITYIYENEGELKELFIQSGVNAAASAGTTILNVQDLQMEEFGQGTYRFTCTTEDGTSDSIIICTRSQ